MDGLRRVEIKIFDSSHIKAERVVVKAPAGKLYTEDGAREEAKNVLAQLHEAFPGVNFKVIPLGRGKFNIVHKAGQA